jgi:hypothetical protein
LANNVPEKGKIVMERWRDGGMEGRDGEVEGWRGGLNP